MRKNSRDSNLIRIKFDKQFKLYTSDLRLDPYIQNMENYLVLGESEICS